MAYATFAQLQAEAPAKLARKATKESFRAGLARVAPPGMRPREERVNNFRTDPTKWLTEWTAAMYA